MQLSNPLTALLLHSKHLPSFEQLLQFKIVCSHDKHLLNPNNEYLFSSHSLQYEAPFSSE